jgi:hypothetical protein
MTKGALVLSFVAIVGIPIAANASLIQGSLVINGDAAVSFGSVAFTPNIFTVASNSTGGFQSLTGTTGTIQDVTNTDGVGLPGENPPIDVADFMTFTDAGITFTLNFLEPGIDGQAGCSLSPIPPPQVQVCTPPAADPQAGQSPFSPVNLQNTGNPTPPGTPYLTSSASFNILGTETDGLGNSVAITGTFTTPFDTPLPNGMPANYQNILAFIGGPGGGTVITGFTAQFFTGEVTTNSPEPSTWLDLIMGFGLVGIAVVYRKRLRKA